MRAMMRGGDRAEAPRAHREAAGAGRGACYSLLLELHPRLEVGGGGVVCVGGAGGGVGAGGPPPGTRRMHGTLAVRFRTSGCSRSSATATWMLLLASKDRVTEVGCCCCCCCCCCWAWLLPKLSRRCLGLSDW